MNKKWIVNSFETDFSWVKDYTDNYIIYDKTCSLEESDKIRHQKNVGYNIYDYLTFIIDNYSNLPDICVFIKANVFKHCKKEVFDTLIVNDFFTPLEYYPSFTPGGWEDRTETGGYLEINNSWYIPAHIGTYGQEVSRYFNSYNHFLFTMFKNVAFPDWIRFAPGGNYIVPKENILFYSLEFYKKLIGFVDYHRIPVEAHIIERALYYIFTNKWEESK